MSKRASSNNGGFWRQLFPGGKAGQPASAPRAASNEIRMAPTVEQAAGKRLANYLSVLTLETQALARACGKSHVNHLEPEDLVALTVEAAAMARVPLAGTDWIPGNPAMARGDA